MGTVNATGSTGGVSSLFMVISLSLAGNNKSQPAGEETATLSAPPTPTPCLHEITSSSGDNAGVGVLKARVQEEAKKKREREGKKDFTCHLHSTRLGLTAVLFNSSDTLAAKKKKKLDKRTDSEEGKEGGMHN